MGRIICELERIYGVRQGSAGGTGVNQYCASPNNVGSSTQQDIANKLSIENDETYRNYKKLTTLIPEIQNLVDDKLAPSVASRIIAKLKPEEQEELLTSLPAIEKLTQKQVQEYIDKIREKEEGK